MRRPGSYLHVRPGAFRAAAIILAVFVGVYALSTDAPVTAQVPVGMDALSVDTNTIGNTQGAIGSIEPCIGNVAPGSSVTIDLAAQGVMAHDSNGTPTEPSDDTGGIIGYQFNLSYDPIVMTVTAVTVGSNAVNLLVANEGSSLFVGGDVLPDSDGSYNSAVIDTGVSLPESGSGVLERITLTIRNDAASGQYNLLIDPDNFAQLDATGAAYRPAAITAGAIAVGQACAPLVTPPPATPAPQTVVLSPTADTYVAAEFPHHTFGNASDLRSDASPLRASYLRFDLPSIETSLLSAKLRMFVSNGSGGVHNIGDVLNSNWSEPLSWAGRPAKGSIAIPFRPGSATGVWLEVDVTSIVAPRTGSPVSLALDTASSDAYHFNSSNAAANGPELVLQYGVPPAVTPSPSAPTPSTTPSPASGISFRGATTSVNATDSASLVISTPPGTAAGDVLVASLAINGPSVWSAPQGWVRMAAVTTAVNPRLFAYYRVAAANEPGAYTWLLNSPAMSSGGIARYSGVDTANPLDGAVSTAGSSTAVQELTVPGFTTAIPGAMLIGAVAINSSKANVLIVGPPAFTERWELDGKRQEFGDGRLGGVGPTGSRTWTIPSPRAAAAWIAALRPAP